MVQFSAHALRVTVRTIVLLSGKAHRKEIQSLLVFWFSLPGEPQQ